MPIAKITIPMINESLIDIIEYSNGVMPNDIDVEHNIINVNKTLTRDLNNNAVLGKTTKTDTSIRKVPIINNLKELAYKLSNIKDEFCFLCDGSLYFRS